MGSASNGMKKIFITVNDGSIARNILRSSVLAGLLSDPSVSLGLIAHKDKADLYRREFGSNRVWVFPYECGPLTLYERVLSFLIRNGLHTRTILMDQRTHIEGRWVMFYIKRVLTYTLGSSKLFHQFIRFLFRFRPPTLFMHNLFLIEKPDLIFSTDVQAELDFDAVSAARKAGVPVVGMVRSWDNLTARGGLVPFIPGKLLVWNPYIKGEAIHIQHIPERVVCLTGIPQFDWYIKKELILSHEKFFRRLSIDPAKRLILFAGEGHFHAPHEPETVAVVSHAMNEGKIPADVAVVFRPHPNFMIDRETIKGLGNIVFDDGVASYIGHERSSWEMDQEKMAHLVNSLYHADILVTTASTMTIDEVAFGKPVVCIAFDGKSREPYWNSVSRYYHDYNHYHDLSRTGGFAIARNAEELVRAINEYLKNPQKDAEGRARIVENFIWKLDGKSGERIAKELLDIFDAG